MLVFGACGGDDDSGSDAGSDAGVSCRCTNELLREGFYRYVERRADDVREQTLQLVRDPSAEGGEWVFGFRYRDSFFGVSPIVGALENGCHFTATYVYDTLVTHYDGLRDCVTDTIAGEARAVAGGFEETFDFSFTPEELPWMIGEDVYRLYGSNSVDLSDEGYSIIATGTCGTYAPTNFLALSADDWSLIGEAASSASFEFSPAYPALLLTWPVGNPFEFDALVDEVGNQPLSPSIAEERCGPSELVNFQACSNRDPASLAGDPNGAGFAGDIGRAGFIALTFPDSQSAPAVATETGKATVRVQLVE